MKPLDDQEREQWKPLTEAGFTVEPYEQTGAFFLRIRCKSCDIKWCYPRQGPGPGVLLALLNHRNGHELDGARALRAALDKHFPQGGGSSHG